MRYDSAVPRRLFTFASLLSLLLLLATAWLWVRSYRTAGEARLLHGRYSRGEYEAGTVAGQVFARVRPDPQPFVLSTVVGGRRVPVSGPVPVIGNTAFMVQSGVASGVPGVGWSESFTSIPMSFGPPMQQVVSRDLVVSLWLACVAFGLLPVLWLAGRVRSGRRGPELCARCGYDLRATPEDQSRYPLNYASRIGAGPGH